MQSIFLDTLRGQRRERPPIWFMRQAGRSLPEYRALRQRYEMLDLIRTPELAATVTMQPIDRFGMDAAIIFADILNPLIGLGMDLQFEKGSGPVFTNPLRSPRDVEKLTVVTPQESVPYTLEALRIVRAQLDGSKALIGFAGAPFTLSYYLIEGGSSKTGLLLKQFIYDYPEAWNLLQSKLIDYTTEYLCAQVEAGAQCVQLFDSWVGLLSPSQYEKFAAPAVKEIITRVRARVAVPVIYLALNSYAFFDKVVSCAADAYSVDWRQSLKQVVHFTGPKTVLQGNLDPALLVCNWDALRGEAESLLAEAASLTNPHIFNLGHGIVPEAKLDNISKLVEMVKAYRYS